MSKNTHEESFYELLKVSPRASISEITSAYLAAKNAFSKDSIATYSLMPAEDNVEVLTLLESAYLTLTNPDKRREYDKKLNSNELSDLEFSVTQSLNEGTKTPTVSQTPTLSASDSVVITLPNSELKLDSTPNLSSTSTTLNLTVVRESKGLSLTDASRITKIPVKYLKAIEEYDSKHLPAMVYVQGFLKNLSQLYRIDSKSTVSNYLEELKQRAGQNSP
jgi:cytoskeletal protein RodZ